MYPLWLLLASSTNMWDASRVSVRLLALTVEVAAATPSTDTSTMTTRIN
jgi:hypothetical protein